MSVGLEQACQVYEFEWEGILIEARYWPVKYSITAHLEVQSITPPRARLPFTQTGYRSHFHPIGTIEAETGGDVEAYVRAWLDEAATSKAWQTYLVQSRQGDLFA